jgi:NAD(P)-dependent dehydrogenase (short-subunit alcohol dehydrogenase family)
MSRRAVVTGANSGIGLATALRLAADGYEVHAGARREEALAEIDQAASAAGTDRIHPLLLDVGDGASVEAAFAEVLAGGAVDVLVNNAGITGAGSVEETDIATYQAMFDTNVLGVVRCTQAVLPAMRAGRYGRVVNISSSSAIASPPLMAAYASTKFAVEAISESLHAEGAPHGIRAIVIRAGTILTPIWGKSGVPPEDTAYPEARAFLLTVLGHQLGHSGVAPEVVADVIARALADDAPALRHLVGDAEVLAGMHERHGDDALEVYALEGEAFRERYRALSGIDYWA